MHVPTCKETTVLLSQAEDRRLSLGEKIGLYLHLVACEGCRQFEKQIDFIRAAMKRYINRDDT